MADQAELEARIRALEDLEAIKELKAKYWRCIDTKLWDEFGTCFAEDARLALPKTPLHEATVTKGRDEIVSFVRGRLERYSMTFHQGQSLEVVSATETLIRVVWRLHDYLVFKPDGATAEWLKGYGFYEDEYVRTDEGWKIKSLKITRLFSESFIRRAW